MAKNVSLAILNQMHQIQQGLASGGFDEHQVRLVLQALIEKNLDSSLLSDSALVGTTQDVMLTGNFLAQTMIYKGQELKRHPRGGGWVPAEQSRENVNMPFVSDDACVGPFAMVYGRARVLGAPRILDSARVYESAFVSDEALIAGSAEVSGHARVRNKATIDGLAKVYESAEVFDDAEIFGVAQICQHARIGGTARIGSGAQGGWNEVKNGLHVPALNMANAH